MQTYRNANERQRLVSGLAICLFSGGLLSSFTVYGGGLEDKLQAQIQKEKQEQADAAAAKEAEAKRLAAEQAKPTFPIPTMVSIPGGTFTMGCDENRDNVEGGCSDDEKPPHEVTLTAFQMAKTEVTVAQFRAFIEATSYKTTAETAGSCYSLDEKGSWSDVKGNSWRKLGFTQTDNDPVACVSWDDANAYIDWLKKETGKPYRLPTEAEWEYAARGGKDDAAYPWGQKGSDGCRYANMADQKAKEKYPELTTTECNDGYIYTAPVGKFQPNAYGLYDMYGNVLEWVKDWYAGDYYKSSPASAPQGASTGTDRMLRGGAWIINAQFMRSALRFNGRPDDRRNFVGFRPAQGQAQGQ